MNRFVGLSVRPSVRQSVLPSVCPPLLAIGASNQHSHLRSDFGPLSPQISPPRPQFSPQDLISSPDLKSALQISNQASKPQKSSPGLKYALQTSNQDSRPQIISPGLKSALKASSLPPRPLLFRPEVCPPDLNNQNQSS